MQNSTDLEQNSKRVKQEQTPKTQATATERGANPLRPVQVPKLQKSVSTRRLEKQLIENLKNKFSHYQISQFPSLKTLSRYCCSKFNCTHQRSLFRQPPFSIRRLQSPSPSLYLLKHQPIRACWLQGRRSSIASWPSKRRS